MMEVLNTFTMYTCIETSRCMLYISYTFIFQLNLNEAKTC